MDPLRGSSTKTDLLQINVLDNPNLALHIHPTLEIEILGERRVLLANIGITDEKLHVIHTHDSDGVLHVESPVPHQFLLRDFFTISGKTLTSKCIFEYCVDDDHVLDMFVNGEKSDLYENLPLRDKDQIKIIYKKNETVFRSPSPNADTITSSMDT